MTALDRLKTNLTPKQYDTLVSWLNDKQRITLLSGGKRSGKSYLLGLMFIILVKRFKDRNLQFSILGATISTVSRNIIPILEMWSNKKIKIGKYNDFELYGNRVTIFGAGDISALESIRGNTVAGVLINECSMLEEECIKESMDRCSIEGAQILIDTNPTGFYEYTYTDIISKGDIQGPDERWIQKCVHFSMLDNTTLPQEYINQQLARYTIGSVDYERHILGKYANKEGLIFYMFNEKNHIIDRLPIGIAVNKYFMAQDFGFGEGHAGSLIVLAKLQTGAYVVLEATVEEGKSIEFWKDKAKDYATRYNANTIYADCARPDLIQEMRTTGINVVNADKSVNLGINYVGDLLSNNSLYLLDSLPSVCFEEFARYSWDTKGKDAPKKEFDNFIDSLRYGVFTENKASKVTTMYNGITNKKYGEFRYDPFGNTKRK